MAITWACAVNPFELVVSFSFRSLFSSQVSKFHSLNSLKLSYLHRNNIAMVDHMQHLDLLLQLQGEMFAGLLQDIVSIFHFNFHCFHGFNFCMGFSYMLSHGQCSHCTVSFQKWPQVDIIPIESLLIVFTFEK